MLETGVLPDNYTFSTLFSALGATGDVDKMFQMLRLMQQMSTQSTRFHCVEIEPDKVTLTVMVESFGKLGKQHQDKIENLWTTYESRSFIDLVRIEQVAANDVWIYNARLAVLGYSDTKKMELFFQKMLSRGVEPNAVTFNTMLTAFSRYPLTNHMKRFYERMKDHRIVPDQTTLGVMMVGYCRTVRKSIDLLEM